MEKGHRKTGLLKLIDSSQLDNYRDNIPDDSYKAKLLSLS